MSDERSHPGDGYSGEGHPGDGQALANELGVARRSRPVKGWWRRNWIGLVGVLVLAPLTIAFTFQSEWGRYYETRPSQPVTVDSGERVEFGGTGWQLVGADRIPGTSPDLADAGMPAGSDLVVVTIEVEPMQLDAEGKAPGCQLQLDQLTGSDTRTDTIVQRSWGDAGFSNIDFELDPDALTYCDSEITEPYTLETLFVIPSDAEGSFGVQVQLIDELPRYLLLLI